MLFCYLALWVISLWAPAIDIIMLTNLGMCPCNVKGLFAWWMLCGNGPITLIRQVPLAFTGNSFLIPQFGSSCANDLFLTLNLNLLLSLWVFVWKSDNYPNQALQNWKLPKNQSLLLGLWFIFMSVPTTITEMIHMSIFKSATSRVRVWFGNCNNLVKVRDRSWSWLKETNF